MLWLLVSRFRRPSCPRGRDRPRPAAEALTTRLMDDTAWGSDMAPDIDPAMD